MTFVFPRKPSHLRADGNVSKNAPAYPQRVDVDNLAKCVMDALNNLLWDDDQQVVLLCALKTFGSPARTELSASTTATRVLSP